MCSATRNWPRITHWSLCVNLWKIKTPTERTKDIEIKGENVGIDLNSVKRPSGSRALIRGAIPSLGCGLPVTRAI